MVGQDLHVTDEGRVLTGVPQVVACLGTCRDPVGAHQGPVQAYEGLTVLSEPVHAVSDIGESLNDHLQGLVQVAVGGSLTDPAVADQPLMVCTVAMGTPVVARTIERPRASLRAGFLGRKQLCRTAPRALAPTCPTPARPAVPRHRNIQRESTIATEEGTLVYQIAFGRHTLSVNGTIAESPTTSLQGERDEYLSQDQRT